MNSISKQTTQGQKQAEDLNRHFTEEDIQMAKRPMKRCSTSLTTTEIQNYNEISPHTGQNGHHQKKSTYKTKNLHTGNAGEGVEKMESSCTVGWNVN